MDRPRLCAVALLLASLAGCGGGGGSGGTMTAVGWTSGVFQAAGNFANKCAAPRTGTDPVTGVAYPDRAGTLLDEKNWLRSWSNDLYLWYDEILDQDPAGASFTTAVSYFKVLKTTATTASGAAKDKFHFTYTTAQWEALSQTGTSAGYGPQWEILSGTPPRDVRIAWMEPTAAGTTASEATLGRGAQLLAVDGADLVNGNTQAIVDTLNAGLFPAKAGETHTFTVSGPGALATRTVTLVSADITTTSVLAPKLLQTTNGTVGYVQFNDHLATSEAQLVSAFTALKQAGISDLVLDLRYNGGGYLAIASEVAYMVAGPAATSGKTFELIRFNAKHPSTDPVAGGTITPTPFYSTARGFTVTSGQALPTLDLQRVFVLTGGGTCSASEAIINGLRGAGVTVVQVGSTTCGKPYGFYPQDNCGTTYFSIEFQGVNALGFGDYTDGFTPQNSGLNVAAGAQLPGCSVADDFSHELGDPAEGRLQAALDYRVSAACPAATGIAPRQLAAARPLDGLAIERPPVRDILLMRR